MVRGVSLVTGGTGFIGRHLVRQLADSGERVRVLDCDLGPSSLPREVDVIKGSVLDAEVLRHALRGVRRIYHLAADPNLWARDKATFHHTNYLGTQAVLRAARETDVERIVFTSTESILMGCVKRNAPITEDSPMPGLSDMPGPYCRSKYLAEQAALEAAAAGLPVVIVNPTLPIGPGDWRMTPPTRMLIGYLTGAFPAYLECQLNLVPVEDAARGHILAAEHGRVGERYILGGENLMLSELLALLGDLTGRPMLALRIPYWMALCFGGVSEFIADHVTKRAPSAPLTGVRLARSSTAFRSTKAKTELGFEADLVRTALARAITWLKETGHIDVELTTGPMRTVGEFSPHRLAHVEQKNSAREEAGITR